MKNNSSNVVFFDIGATLGIPIVSASPRRLTGLQMYKFVPKVLNDLRKIGIRLGIISNTGELETTESMRLILEDCRIYEYFEPDLLLYSSVVHLRKNSPEIFRFAAKRAGLSNTPNDCVFVGEDSWERSLAIEAGLRVAPHPLLVFEVLKGAQLKFICINIFADQHDKLWARVIKNLSILPLQVTTNHNVVQVLAIATNSATARLMNNGFAVTQLPNDPLITDIYLIRDDSQTRTGFLIEEGQCARFFTNDDEASFVQFSNHEGLYVALPAGHSVEGYHLEESQHGHTLKLIPDTSLLEPFGESPNARSASWLHMPATEAQLNDEELNTLKEIITPEKIRHYLDRYTGKSDLDTHGKVHSRHIQSPHMQRVILGLVHDFTQIGAGTLLVGLHQFAHEGQLLDNVQADLAGELDVSDGIVMVTAHLDSTAAFSHPQGSYDPRKHPAPGADDDASGIAAVLAIAEAVMKLATLRKPKRAIRFVLFNAEEHGLVGSKAYARDQAAIEAPIVGVFQMDMIGFNKIAPRSFEVHVGSSSLAAEDVQARSLILAERVGRLLERISPGLGPLQIYNSRQDPAAGRSDHASFHERGYSACAISEDFFAGPGTQEAEPNPNYHKESDTFVDSYFAADIARAVAAAAWITANF